MESSSRLGKGSTGNDGKLFKFVPEKDILSVLPFSGLASELARSFKIHLFYMVLILIAT